jgi:hypothetical protein
VEAAGFGAIPLAAQPAPQVAHGKGKGGSMWRSFRRVIVVVLVVRDGRLEVFE